MVDIDEAVYAWDDDNGSSNESILVTGSFAETDGVAALNRAAARFMCVDDTGVEHTEEAAYSGDIVGDDGEMRYTPNYVSDPMPVEGGLHMYVDSKGAMEPPMAAKLRDILREELAVLGDGVRVTNIPYPGS